MKLAVITQRFPFYERTEFIEDEIPTICQCFNEVIVFSMGHSHTLCHSLPENCHVVRIPVTSRRIFILSAIFRLFMPQAIREAVFACFRLNKRNLLQCLKQILQYEYFTPRIKKSIVAANLDPENTVFMSYWCSEGAYALAQLKEKGIIRHAVSRAHGYDCFIERGYIPYRREVLANLDEIISISEAGKASIEKNLVPYVQGKHANISVSRLGIFKKDNKLNPRNEDRTTLHIVSCSNVIAVKRLDLLIDALTLIEQYTVEWTHFGDGVLFANIQRLAHEKLSHKHNIQYHFAGRVSKDEIFAFYEHHPVDIFMNCSDSEGIPVSIMEAFSYGIPAITRDVGGNSEIVDDINGILIKGGCDKNTLHSAICEMISLNAMERENKRENAYTTFMEKFDSQKNYELLYRRLSLALFKGES